jgi:hypothetical protein
MCRYSRWQVFFCVSVYFLCVCIHVDKYFSVCPSIFCVYVFTLTSIVLCLRLFFVCMYSRWQVFFCVSVYFLCVCIHVDKYFSVSPSIFCVYVFTLTSIFLCLRLFFMTETQKNTCQREYIHKKNRRRHRKILVNVNTYTQKIDGDTEKYLSTWINTHKK